VLIVEQALKDKATDEGTRAGLLDVNISKAIIDNIYSKIIALTLEITTLCERKLKIAPETQFE
jgi:hypothetical protein